MYRTEFWTLGEGTGVMFQENSIETCILSRVKQITSPGGMHETSARAWCTGKTQRDQAERKVGGGIGMGNTCRKKKVTFELSPGYSRNFVGSKRQKAKSG